MKLLRTQLAPNGPHRLDFDAMLLGEGLGGLAGNDSSKCSTITSVPRKVGWP